MRYIRFHLPLFAVLLVCTLALCAYILLQPTRLALQDIAETLEAGQFLCEDGSIWQVMGEEGYTVQYVTVKKVGKIDSKTIKHEFGNKISGELSAAEYAQRVTYYGGVWVDSNGEVWKRSRKGSQAPNDKVAILNLVPFFELSEEEADFVMEVPLEMKKHSLGFELFPDEFDEDVDGYYTLSLLLKEGWQVMEKGVVNYWKTTERTGWQEYRFENGNTTQLPVMETTPHYGGSLNKYGSITQVPGSYRLKVYVRQDGKVVLLAQYDMTTEIKGKTLYIS